MGQFFQKVVTCPDIQLPTFVNVSVQFKWLDFAVKKHKQPKVEKDK